MKRTNKLQHALRQLLVFFNVQLPLWFIGKANKWRLILVVISVIYASLLLFNLGNPPVQWDEMAHLNGGLLLTRGKIQMYFSGGYYPPLYDLITTGYYQMLGVSVASGRLAAVTFQILSIWIIFEFANQAYGPEIALLSSIFLGALPALFWLSIVAMLETILVFFFSLSLFFFFMWIRKGQDKTLVLSGLTLGIGFLAKYQIVIASIVMIASIVVLGRDKVKWRFSKFLLVPIIVFLVLLPWLVLLYQNNGLFNFRLLLDAVSKGDEARTLYSTRFPAPIFYLVEMTWPFKDVPVHPISLPVYILGLAGLGLFAWRRKTEDKFFFTWFVVVYVFFTIIPNKEWRYVISLFPVLAISAATFVFFAYSKLSGAWKKGQVSLRKRRMLKVASLLIVGIAVSSVAYSSYDVYQGIANEHIYIPIAEATSYVVEKIQQNESIMVLAPFNFFNRHMVEFYLQIKKPRQYAVLQYPELPVDAFKPDFNVTALISQCIEQRVKYVFLYEYGGEVPYFQSNMTAMYVYQELYDSGRFVIEDRVGSFPRTITIYAFVQ